MESKEPRSVRVVLLDDHDVARSRSVARLSQHAQMKIVGDVAECSKAVRLVQELRPEAILVETRRLDERGLEAIAVLSALDEETRPAIVAYLEILHRGDWLDARAAGADDLLLKEMSPGTLAGALRSIVDACVEKRANGSSEPHRSD